MPRHKRQSRVRTRRRPAETLRQLESLRATILPPDEETPREVSLVSRDEAGACQASSAYPSSVGSCMGTVQSGVFAPATARLEYCKTSSTKHRRNTRQTLAVSMANIESV